MAGSDTVVSKGRFAEICNVSPGRVTQWIAEGKIGPDALVGEGRSAKIVVAIAQRQIRARTDSGQAFGNGLGTKLAPPRATTRPSEPLEASAPSTDDVEFGDALDEQIKRERLEALQRANRKGAEEEAASQGRFVEATAVRRQMGIVAVQTLRVFEGAQPELATAIASRFSVPEREVLQLLGELFHAIRAQASEKALAAANVLPVVLPAAGPGDEPET